MSLDDLLSEIRECRACAGAFPHEPRPVVRVSARTRLLICGQAPGRRVHESGLPFDDPSGDRLRDWMGIDRATFYDHPAIGVAAMAFCFPGTNPKGGDYPPPTTCAEQWRGRLMANLPKPKLTLLVGGYAQRWALGTRCGRSLSETVAGWRGLGQEVLPLPHPSWRNSGWLKRNPWFEESVVPDLRDRVHRLLNP